MKKLLIICLLAAASATAKAQFTAATLQASGLTCAMCTRAINNSLQKLGFVQSVDADIKQSAFNIVFKPGATADIDGLKQAVEEAGFSVAKLRLTGNFSNVPVTNDGHVEIYGKQFHFVKINNQNLQGTKTITIVDKDFVPAKEFKKFSGATQMNCIKTGKADACCKKSGIAQNARIYHATI